MTILIRDWFISVLVLSSSTLFSQDTRILTGQVFVDDEPMPGVNVIIEGTNLGVTTNLDGYFSLVIPLSGCKLVFQSVGFESKTIEIKNEQNIRVDLKVYCNKDYWDGGKMYVGISSGIHSTPYGFILGASFYTGGISSLQVITNYQFESSLNHNFEGSLNLKHVYSPCNYDLGVEFRVREITLQNPIDFQYNAYELLSHHDFEIFKFDFGLGIAGQTESYPSLGLGLQKGIWLNGIGYLEPFVKSTFFNAKQLSEVGSKIAFRDVQLKINYVQLNQYEQVNLALQIEFYQKRNRSTN